jgi:alanine racemase
VRRDISQSIYTDDFALLAEAGRKLKRRAKVHVKVDTGLGRLGVPYDRTLLYIEKVAAMPELETE